MTNSFGAFAFSVFEPPLTNAPMHQFAMKTNLFTVALVATLFTTCNLIAQPPGRGQGEGPPEMRGAGEGRGGVQNSIMAALDIDGDGELSRREIRNASKALSKMDTNDNGELDQDELGLSATGQFQGADGQQGRGGPPNGGPPGGGDPQQMVQRMMDMDQNGDGNLSPNEVPERMRRMLGAADQDQDGLISQTELENIAGRLGQGGQNQRGQNRGQDRGSNRGFRGQQ